MSPSLPLSSSYPLSGSFNSTEVFSKFLNNDQPKYYLVSSEAERLRLSLLRCADSKKREAVGEGEVEKQEERGLAEECVYQYNLTLSFETTMGRYLFRIST